MRGHEDAPFPCTLCAQCAREVLCYRELDAQDRELIRCLHCGTPADEAALDWRSFEDIEALGYGAVLPEGGCGRPDCGGGRCGNAEPR